MRTIAMALLAVCAALAPRGAFAESETEAYRFSGGEKLLLRFTPAIGELPEQIVSDDGNISLPSGVLLNIKGKTLAEAKKLTVSKALEETTVKQVAVQIIVLEYPPRKISVGGEVRTPKSITLTPGVPLSLLGALQEAGGISEQGDPTRVNVVRIGADGKNTSLTIDATRLAQPGSADLGLRLQAGDTIVVPRGDHFTFSGEFNRTGVVTVGDLRMESGEKPTLVRVIASLGGFKKEADTKKLKILRLKADGSREVLTPFAAGVGAQDPLLLNGDIVEVPSKIQVKENAPAATVSITGKVRTPGVYQIGETGLKLSKLIMLAGGMTEFAKSTKVTLNRPGNNGSLQVIDVRAILKDGAWNLDVELKDGDVVNVPERAF